MSADEQRSAATKKRSAWAWLFTGEYEATHIWLRRVNRLMTPALGAAAFWSFCQGRYWSAGFLALICVARSWDD